MLFTHTGKVLTPGSVRGVKVKLKDLIRASTDIAPNLATRLHQLDQINRALVLVAVAEIVIMEDHLVRAVARQAVMDPIPMEEVRQYLTS